MPVRLHHIVVDAHDLPGLAGGSVIAERYRRRRHQEFPRFLKLIGTAARKGDKHSQAW